MKPTDKKHKGRQPCQDTERLPNFSHSTINNLPDELILEIFDFYRRSFNSYDHQWREKYVWFNLAHVCKKWRAVMFGSASRLDLGITVGPIKPAHIKTILSGQFPILLDYELTPEHGKIAGSALWRMQTVLKLHDRVRGIAFSGGADEVSLYNEIKFFKATSCSFPTLESLVLHFIAGQEPTIPETFLGGPDHSDLHLRRLELVCVSFPKISKFLSSVTSPGLTDLLIDTAVIPSTDQSLLACLQAMPRLRSLGLFISSCPQHFYYIPSEPGSRLSISNGTVLLSKLTCFCYVGPSVFLNSLVVGLSAPSLRDVNIEFHDANYYYSTPPPIVHLPRFFTEIEELYHAIHVTILEVLGSLEWAFRLSLLTQSECIGYCKPRFELGPYQVAPRIR